MVECCTCSSSVARFSRLGTNVGCAQTVKQSQAYPSIAYGTDAKVSF